MTATAAGQPCGGEGQGTNSKALPGPATCTNSFPAHNRGLHQRDVNVSAVNGAIAIM